MFLKCKILERIEEKVNKIMASIVDILAAQGKEKADLAILVGLVNGLLTAVAAETITPAQAQGILDEMNSQDASITTLSTAVDAVVNPPIPTPAPVTPPANS